MDESQAVTNAMISLGPRARLHYRSGVRFSILEKLAKARNFFDRKLWCVRSPKKLPLGTHYKGEFIVASRFHTP